MVILNKLGFHNRDVQQKRTPVGISAVSIVWADGAYIENKREFSFPFPFTLDAKPLSKYRSKSTTTLHLYVFISLYINDFAPSFAIFIAETGLVQI